MKKAENKSMPKRPRDAQGHFASKGKAQPSQQPKASRMSSQGAKPEKADMPERDVDMVIIIGGDMCDCM